MLGGVNSAVRSGQNSVAVTLGAEQSIEEVYNLTENRLPLLQLRYKSGEAGLSTPTPLVKVGGLFFIEIL